MLPLFAIDIFCEKYNMGVKGRDAVERWAVSSAVVFGVIVFYGMLQGGYTFGETLETYLAIVGGLAILYYVFEKLSQLIKSKKKTKGGQI